MVRVSQVQEDNKDVMDALELTSTTKMARLGEMTTAGIYGRNVCLEKVRSRRNLLRVLGRNTVQGMSWACRVPTAVQL